MPTKNPNGRPPKYKTAEELQIKINKYFKSGIAKRKVLTGPPNNRKFGLVSIPTITGLVLYCGFCDRVSFYDMEKKPEFTYTIKNARTRIEQNYEELLLTGLGAGAIFGLKNFGWKDEQYLKGEGIASIININIKSPDKLINIAERQLINANS